MSAWNGPGVVNQVLASYPARIVAVHLHSLWHYVSLTQFCMETFPSIFFSYYSWTILCRVQPCSRCGVGREQVGARSRSGKWV